MPLHHLANLLSSTYFASCLVTVGKLYFIACHPFSHLNSELSRRVHEFTVSDLLTLLKSQNSAVAASSARLFCVLISFSGDGFSEATLNVVLYALACLDDEDMEFQACGTSIILVLMDHGGFEIQHSLI
jgi:hypothetical protein